ncbi:MAG: phospho-N-acetylmuramoyl-pentapeptide-transferase [Lachnospiraceae bacterium]|nr:phospho-N-acetylmuramoyl-pentapeptide-transferase [Candidatus Equihabitans merdae]
MNQLSIVLPSLIGLGVSAAIGPFLIPFLRRLKMGQTERKEGVQSHLKKAGTPTMGGIMILIGMLAGSIFFIGAFPKVGPVLFLSLAFGLIGFIDDYLKVVKKHSDGLLAWQKLILQFIVTLVFYFYMVKLSGVDMLIRLPFTGGKMLDIGFWAVPLMFFAVIGTVNGTNFTDGLDGLASSVTVVVAIFLAVASLALNAGVHPIGAAMAGGLIGFLCYNAYPAQVFMGDTGSLALGGFVAGMAYMMNMPIYIIIIGLIYLAEVVSVMMQVSYFKATHGKRIFKMTPIHHHFELCGWSETRIVTIFTGLTVLLCIIGYVAI